MHTADPHRPKFVDRFVRDWATWCYGFAMGLAGCLLLVHVGYTAESLMHKFHLIAGGVITVGFLPGALLELVRLLRLPRKALVHNQPLQRPGDGK